MSEQKLNGQLLPDLQAKGLHLFWMDLDRFEPDPLEEELLSDDEQQRAARFVTPTLRHRYTAAHLFLRHTLARFCDARPEQLSFTDNAWGKPSLTRHPAIDFNLSHSHHLALVGVQTSDSADPADAIGVDIEVLQRWPDEELRSLGQTIMTAAEQQALLAAIQSSNAHDNASHAFLTAWTRKEACVKALGLGLSYDVRQLNVGLAAVNEQVLAPANGDSLLADHKLWLQTTTGPEEALISVASLGQVSESRL